MIHGDDFAPHPTLAPFSRKLEPDGLFFYDSDPGSRGTAVVLIHGNGDEADSWRHVLTRLALGRRVIAPDLPGFGRSSAIGQGKLPDLAAGVQRILESEGVQTVHLVGSSMGAVVAALVAQQVQASSLVLCGGSASSLDPTKASAGIKALLEPGVGEAYYSGLRQAGIEAAYDSLKPYYAHLERLSENDRAFLHDRVWARVWSDSQRTAFFAGLRSLFDPNLGLDIAKLEPLRTLLLWGEHDQIVPLEAAHALQAKLPNSRMEVIAEAGHLPHQERPEAFVTALEAFWGQA
jgi:pimeloyl-ACP methyl ester carboxylesterase